MPRTSVLIASAGFQLSGGIILQMPYLLPSVLILRIYSIGSRNSSSVGRKVGASDNPNKRFFFGSSLGRPRCPRLGTVDKSRGSARLALSGMAWLLPDGGPFKVPGAEMTGVLPFDAGAMGTEEGLSRIPGGMGMGMAWNVGPWAIAGMAMSARQWARRPRCVGCSQDVVRRRISGVRVGNGGRRGGLSLISGRCDGIDAARRRNS